MLNRQEIQEGKNIVEIMKNLSDEGKLIVCSFAEGALKMQELYRTKEDGEAAH